MESTKQFIFTVRNDFFPSNTYLLKSRTDNTCVIIDPGLDKELIEKRIDELDLKPLAVIATHGHFDHIGSATYFKNKFNIPFYMHEADLKISQSANFFLKIARIPIKIETPVPDVLLRGKTGTITAGEFTFAVHNFPGHSEGSCIFHYDNYLFSGDTIYKKGLGFNNFPGEDKNKLKHSILELLQTFPGQSLVFPGHGEAESLEKIKNNNPDLINFLNLKGN